MSKGGRFERKVKAAPHKGRKTALIIVCALAVLVLGVGVIGGIYVNNMLSSVNHVEVAKPVYTEPVQEAAQTAENAAEPAAETTEAAEKKEESSPEDYANYLIVCKPVRKDGSVKKTDTMILCTLNKRTKTMTMTSLLEEALVQTPEYKKHNGGEATLDTVYGLGATYGSGTAGSMEFMNQTLYDNFGIEIDENFEIDLKLFARVVTRLGQVKIELTEEEAKYLSEAANKDIQAGEQTMDGKLAQEYVQMWSDEDAEGISSISGQRKMVEAILNTVRSQYVGDLENIVKDIMPSITTSLNYKEFREFLLSMLPLVRNLSIENGGTCPVEYQAELVDVDGDGTEEEVLTFDAAQATKAMRALTKGETE